MDETADDAKRIPSICDREWTVVAIGGDAVSGRAPALRFSSDGSLSGSTGVNRLIGRYEIVDGALVLAGGATTRMASSPEAMRAESRFLAVLNDRPEISWTGDEMVIGSGDERLTLRSEEPPDRPAVRGSVAYRERIAMPPGAELTVSLLDVSRADALAVELATVVLHEPGNVPVAFELPYEPAVIDPRNSYVVRATIKVDDVLHWTTTDAIHVITGGHPTEVDIMLTRIAH
jgi:putative lipoprotein